MKRLMVLLAFMLVVLPASSSGQALNEKSNDPCICCGAPVAQEIQNPALGSIAGRVLESRNAFPGVTITASRGKFKREVITDADGRYVILNMDSGFYTVEAGLAGLVKATRRNVRIESGKAGTVDFAMKLPEQEEITFRCGVPEPRPGVFVITREMMDYLPIH